MRLSVKTKWSHDGRRWLRRALIINKVPKNLCETFKMSNYHKGLYVALYHGKEVCFLSESSMGEVNPCFVTRRYISYSARVVLHDGS